MERENRGWTYEALASRMESAGCPIQASAIHKIEKAGRRITVDELMGFAAAFELGVPDLLRPREVVISARLAKLFDAWEEARITVSAASERRDAAFRSMAKFVQENHGEALEPFWEMVSVWAEDVTSEDDSPAMVEAVRAMVMARAVPVETFKDVEREAFEKLAAEESVTDGE